MMWRTTVAALILVSFAAQAAEEPVAAGDDTIAVKNPKRLPARMPCRRIGLGVPGDYKPCIAQLASGDLLVVGFAKRLDRGFEEYFISFRSTDGGLTWGPRTAIKGIHGREPFVTVLADGTLLMSAHILPQDVNNQVTSGKGGSSFWYSFIYRSTDEGRTWSTLILGPENWPTQAKVASDRKAVQLPDGTVLMGVSTGIDGGPQAFMWRSKDSGKSWDKSIECDAQGWRDTDGFFSNSDTFRLPSGNLLHVNRVDGRHHPLKGRPFPGGNDNTDRSILWESADEGKTWRKLRDMGEYGEMYPQFLQLADGRILYNFTVRGLTYPLGIQAIVSYDQGRTWDFDTDRIIVASRTPKGKASGGGYGNTIQLAGGMLVTSYSYRGEDNKTHLEVVRWKLPASKQSEKGE